MVYHFPVLVFLVMYASCTAYTSSSDPFDPVISELKLELESLKKRANSERGGEGGAVGSCPSGGSSNLNSRLDRLEILMSMLLLRGDIDNVKVDQEDVRKHLLKRLQSIEEKAEWCLTNGERGTHPLYTRLTQLEVTLQDYIKDFRPKTTNGTARVPSVYKDCQEAYNAGWKTSGIYRISPDGSTELDVFCEQKLDGGGWLVFQRRQDGSVDFYRTWADYKAGFGDLNGEFWLGNDNIRLLTKNKDQDLKIELRSPGGEFAYASYSEFWIEDESQYYKLHISGYSGGFPPGDSLGNLKLQKFSTKDRDNDVHASQCARLFYGGWWYSACHSSNLNGLYGNTTYAKGLSWRTWLGYHLSMTSTKMMLKKKVAV